MKIAVMGDAAIKIAKSVHIGRYSAGLLAGPAPTSTGVTIPNSAKFTSSCCVGQCAWFRP
jgi:hypothetical protein